MSIPNKVSASSALTHPHEFKGELAVAVLGRLVEALEGGEGRIVAHLVADRNSGYPRLYGQLDGELGLKCQRCNKRYDWPLDVKMDLRLVFSEQEEKAVLQGSDPYLVEDDELPLRDLVEEEVLLALPMLPRCETCENSQNAVTGAPKKASRKVEAQRDNPFAVLKGKLKQ